MKHVSKTALRRPRDLGPNAHLIGQPRSRRALATPALILDLDRLARNLKAMAALCRRAGVSLRPHAKTHKSIAIAQRQIAQGAIGICAATVREAAVMTAAGVPGVLLTTPVTGAVKIDAVCDLAGHAKGFMAVVDSAAGAAALETALRRRRRKLAVLIDVDIGMGRTGVPDVAGVVSLVRRLQSSPALTVAGIQAYSGGVQHIARAAARARVYGKQLRHLAAVVAAMNEAGCPPAIVSGGGTGSFDIDRHAGLFTECQCGSYAVMDAEYDDVQLFAGGPHPFKIALYVQCSVVSRNHRGWSTIDGGSKCFSLDGPLPRPARGAPPGAAYQFFGDEFGRVEPARTTDALKLGSKIEFIAPHCDPTINLHDYYHCVRGDVLVDIWPVDARGPL
jgi:D-serine deaminase-like pyridoxal phosphate-dependent protein